MPDDPGIEPYELYFRNPVNYIRELQDVGAPNRWAWDRGVLSKRQMDPIRFANLHLLSTDKWDALCVGDQGTAHYTQDSKNMAQPIAVYPTWEGHEDLELLIDMIENPFGENREYCTDPTLPLDERPVWGQRHVVVIARTPNMSHAAGKRFARTINDVQLDYPEVTLYIHGSYSYPFMFGLDLRAADTDPRAAAAKGKIMLESGKVFHRHHLEEKAQSDKRTRVHGYSWDELSSASNRCKFNIKAVLHASQYWKSEIVLPTRMKSEEVDAESTDLEFRPSSNQKRAGRPTGPVKPGDKIQCDTCSLVDQCKFYREGSVCSLSDSEIRKLSEFFDTRDSGKLMQGLQKLLVKQADRLESATNAETISGENDPEIDKQINKLFDNTVKYAKLVDPSLSKPAVNINVGTQGQLGTQGSAKEIAQKAMRELVDRGFTPGEITPQVLKDYMAGKPVRRAIEGEIINE